MALRNVGRRHAVRLQTQKIPAGYEAHFSQHEGRAYPICNLPFFRFMFNSNSPCPPTKLNQVRSHSNVVRWHNEFRAEHLYLYSNNNEDYYDQVAENYILHSLRSEKQCLVLRPYPSATLLSATTPFVEFSRNSVYEFITKFSKQAWVLWKLDHWYSYFTLGHKWTCICNSHIRLTVWTKFGTGGLHVMSLSKYEDYETGFRERHVLLKGGKWYFVHLIHILFNFDKTPERSCPQKCAEEMRIT